MDGKASFSFSGSAVSVNAAGDRMAIGAAYGYGGAGSVGVYQFNGAAWSQVGADIVGGAGGDNSGSAVSMNAAGDRVAIGSPEHSNYAGQGLAAVYEYSGSAWTQLGNGLVGAAAGDQCGWTVSLNAAGDVLAVGCPGDDSKGVARVYSLSGAVWVQRGADMEGQFHNDRCGSAVALSSSGDIVAVGAPGKSLVRVHRYIHPAWSQLGGDIDGSPGQSAGSFVDINAAGDRIVYGGTFGANSKAAAYAYNASAGWTQMGAGQTSPGRYVAMNDAGDRAAVGWAEGDNSGTVRVYEYSTSTAQWAQLGDDLVGAAPGDYARNPALNAAGDILAIGAFEHNSATGHVRAFQAASSGTYSPTPAPTSTPAPTPAHSAGSGSGSDSESSSSSLLPGGAFLVGLLVCVAALLVCCVAVICCFMAQKSGPDPSTKVDAAGYAGVAAAAGAAAGSAPYPAQGPSHETVVEMGQYDGTDARMMEHGQVKLQGQGYGHVPGQGQAQWDGSRSSSGVVLPLVPVATAVFDGEPYYGKL